MLPGERATPNSNHIPDGTNLSIALPFYREPIFAINCKGKNGLSWDDQK
jgi:hypothetical protein